MPKPAVPTDHPLAVWPCTTRGNRPAEVRAELARRVVDDYSGPGHVVLDLACRDGSVVDHAAASSRRAIGVVAGSCDAPRSSPSTERRATGPDLRPRRGRPLPEVLADLRGRVHLAVALPNLRITPSGPVPVHPCPRGAVRLCRTAAPSLRPGGLLVVGVVGGAGRYRGHDRDALSTLVEAAASAGFDYLQHVVALLVPIADGELAPPWNASTGRVVVHADLGVVQRAGR